MYGTYTEVWLSEYYDSGLQTTEPKQAVQMVAEERLLDRAVNLLRKT